MTIKDFYILCCNQNYMIAYDGFDYPNPVGTSLSGLNGGTGWLDAYSTTGSITLANPLVFNGLPSGGKSIMFDPSATLTRDGRNWVSSLIDGTYWYSFLIKPTSTPTTVGRGTFGILQGSDTEQNGFGIRYDFTGTIGANPALIFNAQTAAQAAGSDITFTNGFNDTYLVIGNIVVVGSIATNSIWVYRSGTAIPASEAALGPAMSNISGSVSGANPAMYGRAFQLSAAPTFFDEVRISTSYVDIS